MNSIYGRLLSGKNFAFFNTGWGLFIEIPGLFVSKFIDKYSWWTIESGFCAALSTRGYEWGYSPSHQIFCKIPSNLHTIAPLIINRLIACGEILGSWKSIFFMSVFFISFWPCFPPDSWLILNLIKTYDWFNEWNVLFVRKFPKGCSAYR